MNAFQAARLRVISVLFAGLSLAGQANAGLLGNSLGFEILFPDLSTICCGSGNFVVGAGVELPVGSIPSYNPNAFVDASDLQIEYGQTDGTGYVPGAFNGFHFFDVFFAIDDIVGVSINPATNLAGFDLSRLSFDTDNIYINMQGLSADFAHHVVLDIVFARAPEPATLALLGLGLAGLGFSRRKH